MLAVTYPAGEEQPILFKALAWELVARGHEVVVVTLQERWLQQQTSCVKEHGVTVLRVTVGNLFNNVSRLKKFVNMLKLPGQLLKAVKQHIPRSEFDLLIGHTPYAAEANLISPLKAYFKCPALLVLWDIFPQNAIDLEMIRFEFLRKWLRKKEVKMLT